MFFQSLNGADDPERSDPSVIADGLTEDQPILFLNDAKVHYGSNQRPPFIVAKRSPFSRTVVIPTKDGARPKEELAVLVQIQARPWDKDSMFWTMDRNGKRYIVKSFQGLGYRCWAGPEMGFIEKPFALSFIKSSEPDPTDSTSGDEILPHEFDSAPQNRRRSSFIVHSGSSSDSDTSESEDDERDSSVKTSRQLVVSPAVSPAKRRKLDISSHELNQLDRVSPPARRRPSIHAPIEEHQPESPRPSNTLSKTEQQRKQLFIDRIEKDLNRSFKEIFTPWGEEITDLSRHTLQEIWKVIGIMKGDTPQRKARALNRAVNGDDNNGKPQLDRDDGNKPMKKCFVDLVQSLKSAQESESRSPGPFQTDLPLIPLDDDLLQPDEDQDVSPPPQSLLTPYKQTRTTLIVRVAPSPKYLPIKLGECTTSKAFYGKVLDGVGIRQDDVAEMSVTFAWMAAEDRMRTMTMISHVDSCFEHLIEQVDEAPIWTEAPEGKGRCVLEVEIVKKG